MRLEDAGQVGRHRDAGHGALQIIEPRGRDERFVVCSDRPEPLLQQHAEDVAECLDAAGFEALLTAFQTAFGAGKDHFGAGIIACAVQSLNFTP